MNNILKKNIYFIIEIFENSERKWMKLVLSKIYICKKCFYIMNS